MSLVETRLEKAGLSLPPAPEAAGIYDPAVRSGDLVFTSGQLPFVGGELIAEKGCKGKVNEVNQALAAHAARIALLNALAAVKGVLGDLDHIERVVRLTVYVASESFFANQHIVANGASAVLYEAFGEKGRHARCAVGVAELPLDASVEIDLVVSVRKD